MGLEDIALAMTKYNFCQIWTMLTYTDIQQSEKMNTTLLQNLMYIKSKETTTNLIKLLKFTAMFQICIYVMVSF